MGQITLSPEDQPRPNTFWKPHRPIPANLRSFGKYPNTADWRPADLLLVSSVAPDAVTKQIIAAQQRGGFGPDDARWQHAAVYLDDGFIMEATRRGVQYVPIYSYVGTRRLRLRRPVGLKTRKIGGALLSRLQSGPERNIISVQSSISSSGRFVGSGEPP